MIKHILHHTIVSKNLNNPTKSMIVDVVSQPQPQAYTQAACDNAPPTDSILEVISQLIEQMIRMNSHMEKI